MTSPRPRPTFQSINTETTPRNDVLRFKGNFVLKGPATFDSTNPQVTGARIVDATLPTGPFENVNRRGWTKIGGGKAWIYIDGNVPPANGIVSVLVRNRNGECALNSTGAIATCKR